MTALPIEHTNGQAFGRCAICRGRTSVERHGKPCWMCRTYGPPSRYRALTWLVLAVVGPGGVR